MWIAQPNGVVVGGGGEPEFVPGRSAELGPFGPGGLDQRPERCRPRFHPESLGGIGLAGDLAPRPVGRDQMADHGVVVGAHRPIDAC